MIIDSQRLGFKISSLDHRYSRKLQQNLSASRDTFCDLETPGWTSLMRSEISERTRRNNLQKQQIEVNEKSIFNRLNEVKYLQWSSKDEKRMLKQKQGDKNQTRDTDYLRPQSLQRQSKHKFSKQEQKKDQNKRWNQITVHQHLYRNSFKMQNKKMINKVLDEEYKNKVLFKFTPTINKKSIVLAESKFEKNKQDGLLLPAKEENTIHTEATDQKQKQDRQVQRYRILNKTFYFLSEGNTILAEKSLQNSILALPMPCLKVIQSIIVRIYQGRKMEWLDFLQSFNDKNIKGKEGFYAIMAKWFSRNEAANQSHRNEAIIKD